MQIVISPAVTVKLQNKVPPVSRTEVEQCFQNRKGRLLIDNREKNRTDPPTMWFIARTNKSRTLKIVFIQIGQDMRIKSAYDPNEVELYIYNKLGLQRS